VPFQHHRHKLTSANGCERQGPTGGDDYGEETCFGAVHFGHLRRMWTRFRVAVEPIQLVRRQPPQDCRRAKVTLTETLFRWAPRSLRMVFSAMNSGSNNLTPTLASAPNNPARSLLRVFYQNKHCLVLGRSESADPPTPCPCVGKVR